MISQGKFRRRAYDCNGIGAAKAARIMVAVELESVFRPRPIQKLGHDDRNDEDIAGLFMEDAPSQKETFKASC